MGLEYLADGTVKIKAGDGEHLWSALNYIGSDVKDANVLSGGGYFGVHASSNSDNIEIFKPDTK